MSATKPRAGIRHTYTDTLFTRPEEIADLRRSGDRAAGTRLVFFELLYKALQPAPRELPVRTATQKASSRPVDAAPISEESRQRLEGRARALSAFAVTPQNQFFLKHFTETCAERGVACRFIIEPMPASLPRMNTSLLRDLAPGVEIVDVNEFAVFPDFAFRDGLHLRSPDWTSYYRTILSDQGLMSFGSFVSKAAPWNGENISFGAGPNDERLVRIAGFHTPESWGCWTDGTLAEAFVNIGDGAARSHRLTMAITMLVKKGPQRVAVAINGDERCSQTLTESGDTSLSCDLPDGMKGPTKIEVSTSYASSPKDWGEDDLRSLGVGLRSMSSRVGSSSRTRHTALFLEQRRSIRT